MTSDEFYESVESWGELISFCHEHDMDNYVSDIYDGDYIEREIIDEHIEDFLRSNMWYELRDALSGIELDRYDYYRVDGELDYVNVTDDFRTARDNVFEYLEAVNFFDEDFEDEDEYEEWDADYDENGFNVRHSVATAQGSGREPAMSIDLQMGVKVEFCGIPAPMEKPNINFGDLFDQKA